MVKRGSSLSEEGFIICFNPFKGKLKITLERLPISPAIVSFV